MLNNPGLDWNLVVTFAAAWLLTYAIHSTLLLGAVWGLGRRAFVSPALQDTLWKVALVGGILTATWQTAGWGHAPLGGRLEMAAPPRAQAAVIAPAAPEAAGAASQIRRLFGDPATPPSVEHPAPASRRSSWEFWMLLLWGAGAAAGLLRLVWARIRLTRLLNTRRPLEHGPLRHILDRLCVDAGETRRIRLSTSSRIGGPVALAGREICLPRRAVTDLDPEQQQNALAHELAHLIRRDPAWRWISAVLESLFFFQPLHRVARRGLKDSAEFLCDDWAVTQTGQHLTLAKCLVEVAGWLDPRLEAVHAASMAEPGSPLVRRVERLLGVRASREIPAAWRVAGAVTLLAAVMAVAPVVTAVHEPSQDPQEDASFGGTAFAQAVRPSAPLLFDGVGPGAGRGFGQDPLDLPAPPEPPAPPAFHPDVAGIPPIPHAGSLAPRAASRSVFRSHRIERRSARRIAESVVVFTSPSPEPAVVWTVELPAAAVRAKLAELRTVLDRHRELESQVLPALEAQMDAQSLERLAEFLKQIGEAQTLSLEVSTPLERFEPQLRMEALQEEQDAQRMELQILIQQLDRLRKSATPKADWMPIGSI